MQLMSTKNDKQQVQGKGLASSDDLHIIEVDWYEKKLYFGRFYIFEMQRTDSLTPTERVIHNLLHNDCTPNYALVLSGNTRMITHVVITFLFHTLSAHL